MIRYHLIFLSRPFVSGAFTEYIKYGRDDSGKGNFEEGHAFIGFQKDTPAAIVFQASKQLKKFRKGLSMNTLTESSILGNIPSEELVKEEKGSDMWKDIVGHEVPAHNVHILILHAHCPWTGAEVEQILAAPDCF